MESKMLRLLLICHRTKAIGVVLVECQSQLERETAPEKVVRTVSVVRRRELEGPSQFWAELTTPTEAATDHVIDE
jgi:hypothetical protein